VTNMPEYQDHLAILDVGHGNCAVIMVLDWVAVVDAGPKIWLEKFLATHEIMVVNEVLLSHPDRDHIAGLVQLLASRKATVRRVWVNEDVEKDTDLWSDLVCELNKADNARELVFERVLTRDSSGQCAHGPVEIEILHPTARLLDFYRRRDHPKGIRLSGHSINAVVRVVRNNKPVVILFGDLDQTGFSELSELGLDLATPIAVFPHHGGGTGNSDVASFTRGLCAAVRPNTVVFSNGRGVHDMPDPNIVTVVREYLPRARVVCTQLSLHCADAVPPEDPSHLSTLSARGREQGWCCAGSILVSLKELELTPVDTEHGAFLAQYAHRRCVGTKPPVTAIPATRPANCESARAVSRLPIIQGFN
jgi:beta-lactamase superfamily II metal-dependent hydrolase